MKLKEIVSHLEALFPLELQESYDNSGLLTGNSEMEITGTLLCLDITDEVLDEAINKGLNLVISHHPLVFHGLKKLTGAGMIERLVIKAISHNLALYSMHTNFDNLHTGTNAILADKLHLLNQAILDPVASKLQKLVTFVPVAHAEAVRLAIFEAGAGHIGQYDMCSFYQEGTGTFRASGSANPFVGKKNEMHLEPEVRIETVLPSHLQGRVIHALLSSHPYEEVVYDIYPLENKWAQTGMGMIGELAHEASETDFLSSIKSTLSVNMLRHSKLTGRKIKKVAVCGGSGSFLIPVAKRARADALVTADLKYHQFYEGDGNLLLIDAGHFETEQFVLEIFHNVLIKKFPNFAIHFSESGINPVNYF